MPDDFKPTIKMDGDMPVITIPLSKIAQGMRIEGHRAIWEEHGIRVDVTVLAQRIPKGKKDA